jgi:hypothetical protein
MIQRTYAPPDPHRHFNEDHVERDKSVFDVTFTLNSNQRVHRARLIARTADEAAALIRQTHPSATEISVE